MVGADLGGANQVATWTFMVLWVMRLSAKLNVYLGVPNLTEEFLPAHLLYLKSFLARKPMNLLFPVSVTASTVVATHLVDLAASANGSSFEAVGLHIRRACCWCWRFWSTGSWCCLCPTRRCGAGPCVRARPTASRQAEHRPAGRGATSPTYSRALSAIGRRT